MESLNSTTKEIQEIKNAAAATEKVTASLCKENDKFKAEVDKLVCHNVRLGQEEAILEYTVSEILHMKLQQKPSKC